MENPSITVRDLTAEEISSVAGSYTRQDIGAAYNTYYNYAETDRMDGGGWMPDNGGYGSLTIWYNNLTMEVYSYVTS